MKATSLTLALGALSLATASYAQLTDDGLVGFYNLTAVTLDTFGDTIGGIGSAVAIKPGTWYKDATGVYHGTIITQPDRGHNTQGTIDYPSRQEVYDFTLIPYEGTANGGAIGSMTLTYTGGLRYTDTGSLNGLTTGLNPTGVRAASAAFPALPIAGSNDALCIDAEGIAYLSSGDFFMSDEYGPYIYHMSAAGVILSAIQPPQAILPLDASGNLDFTAETDPTTGRVANQGFECLTISPDNQLLYATLQSATVQDGGSSDARGKYTRMLRYDISKPDAAVLTGEWVVELPTSSKQAYGVSDMYYIDGSRFMLLARDGDGNGNGDPPTPSNGDLKAGIKNIGIFDISAATNIAGTQYDSPANPVAPGGTLVAGVTPAVWAEFLSLINDADLAKAGLHNGRPQYDDIVGKFESIAVTSALDAANPNDYFVFSVADNDFITANGIEDGQPYADPYAVGTGFDVPMQFLVHRATLPGFNYASYINRAVISPSMRARARRADSARRLDSTF